MTAGTAPSSPFGPSPDLFERLAGVLLSEETVDAVLHLLVSLASSSLSDVAGASISLVRTGNFQTRRSTSEDVQELDRVQYEQGGGPCVEATLTGTQVSVSLADAGGRWPAFAAAAVDKGFSAVLSTPLAVRDQRMGALNLYARGVPTFPTDEVEEANRFARGASIVLSNAVAFYTAEMMNEQLREAVETRDIIGQAKGVLIARQHCNSQEAFNVLRRASQRSNRKLRDIAQEIVEGAQQRRPGP